MRTLFHCIVHGRVPTDKRVGLCCNPVHRHGLNFKIGIIGVTKTTRQEVGDSSGDKATQAAIWEASTGEPRQG